MVFMMDNADVLEDPVGRLRMVGEEAHHRMEEEERRQEMEHRRAENESRFGIQRMQVWQEKSPVVSPVRSTNLKKRATEMIVFEQPVSAAVGTFDKWMRRYLRSLDLIKAEQLNQLLGHQRAIPICGHLLPLHTLKSDRHAKAVRLVPQQHSSSHWAGPWGAGDGARLTAMGASAASVDSTGGGGGESSEHQLATDLLLHASRSGDPLGGRYVAGKLEHGRQVVVKVFKDVKGNELKAFKQRVETLCGLDLHLHLLLPIGWGIWESCCFVVYDMLDQTDAEKRLLVSRRGGRPFLWADRLRLVAAVASIARSVVHRASRPAARRSCLLGSPHLNLKLSSVVFDRSWKSIPVQMG
ncbi:Putative LRR receptor-like serine/threonine-protein kinase [Durusdinium trenchii]|uniref:LRR receptor-like serine/threonine-protein kinase n=1 Tax=Durusdinium trenchii TaxID=1381693 RepID=A0ABP0S749_9DINO